jgi:hypothetical protein
MGVYRGALRHRITIHHQSENVLYQVFIRLTGGKPEHFEAAGA